MIVRKKNSNSRKPGGFIRHLRTKAINLYHRTFYTLKALLLSVKKFNFIKLFPKLSLKTFGKLLLILSSGALLLGFTFYLLVLLGLFGALPGKSDLKLVKNTSPSEVYSSDGVLMGRYYIQDRTNISYGDISPNVISALIATEDARFYKHRGIDARSMFRVFFKTLLFQQESSGGGSTLSQQLAKNLYPRKPHIFLSTPINKLKEMIIANRLEDIYTKEEILELYLNTVPFGGNIYGIERAARRYFDTSAKKLKVQQAATLVGMLKATTTYNPKNHPDRAKERRNVVLAQMAKYRFIEAEKLDSLKQLPLILHLNGKNLDNNLAPYFREQLRLELEKWCAEHKKSNGEKYNLYTDGLKIYTTIDSKIQAHAEKAVIRKMAALQDIFDRHWGKRQPWGNNVSFVNAAVQQSPRYQALKEQGLSEEEINVVFRKPVKMKIFTWWGSRSLRMSPRDSVRYYQRLLNTGLLSIEPQTGFVKAWVGGIDHKSFKYDHVLSRRQVGSTFKPFVYAAALERGIEPCQYFKNERMVYPAYENWSPQNADGQYGGEYSMRGALANSVNTVSAQILMQAGIEPTISLAHQMGIHNDIPKVPSIALGTANLSLMEMVTAYSTFANRGQYHTPVYLKKIVAPSGEVLLQAIPQAPRQAFSEQNAQIMLELMKGVVEEGSAASLRSQYGLTMDIAGKTGTTQNQSDGWFIGITPNLVTGVWVGAESPIVRFRTLELGQGAKTALPVWAEFMRRVSEKPGSYNPYMRFVPLPYELESRLACASFRYDEPVIEEEESFFDKIFKRKPGKERKGIWKIFGGRGKKDKHED